MMKKCKSRSTLRKIFAAVCAVLMLSCLFAVCCFATDGAAADVDGRLIVKEMVEILIAGITSVAEGIGAGLSALATNIFLTSAGGISVFGVLVLAFGGISLALGLSYMIVNWVTSLGN